MLNKHFTRGCLVAALLWIGCKTVEPQRTPDMATRRPPDMARDTSEVPADVLRAIQLQKLSVDIARIVQTKVPSIKDVNVACSGDSATVTGIAPNAADRDAAGRAVLESGKIKELNNAIEVRPR